MKPRLLDLFCGAGGATRGYQLAGFHVTGVDIAPQPHYCGDEFVQTDAMTFPLDGFDAYPWDDTECHYCRRPHPGKDYPPEDFHRPDCAYLALLRLLESYDDEGKP